MAGWIRLHRSLADWEWYTDSKTLHLFLHLLIKANHKPARHRGTVIERGQLLTGRKQLASETGISEQSVRTALTRLKSTNEITIQSTKKFSVVTICNYDKYQDVESEANQVNNQPTNQQPTNSQPTTNHKQECKKLRNINTPPYSPPAGQEEPPPPTDEDFCGVGGEDFSPPAVVPREGHPQGIVQVNPNSSFEQFWDVWNQATAAAMNRPDGSGKDEGKEAAWLVWAEREKFRNVPGLSDLMEALMNHSESHQWTKQGGQFIPSAENWLRKGKWADRLPKACDVVQQGTGDGPTYNGMRINSVHQGLVAENDAIARRKLEKLRRQGNDGSPVAIGQS